MLSLSANDLLHDEMVNEISKRTWSNLPKGWILKPNIPHMVRGKKYPAPIRVTTPVCYNIGVLDNSACQPGFQRNSLCISRTT